MAIPVQVVKPIHPPLLSELRIAWPLSNKTPGIFKTPGDSLIRLLGATPKQKDIQRNDFLRVSLFWEVVEMPAEDYQVGLRLLAADGAVALAETSSPSFGRYPTTRWAAGERVRDNHALWIPGEFPTGVYRLQVQLLDGNGQPVGDWLELGQLAAKY